jgi:hypothetical protein
MLQSPDNFYLKDYRNERVLGWVQKGHRRHWSLDLVAGARAAPGTKMYLYIQMQLCRSDSLHDWLRHNRTAHSRADMVCSSSFPYLFRFTGVIYILWPVLLMCNP